jgi:phosphatidylinositol glycan class O
MAEARAAKDAEDQTKGKIKAGGTADEGAGTGAAPGGSVGGKPKTTLQKINERKAERFRIEWYWVFGFFVWLL